MSSQNPNLSTYRCIQLFRQERYDKRDNCSRQCRMIVFKCVLFDIPAPGFSLQHRVNPSVGSSKTLTFLHIDIGFHSNAGFFHSNTGFFTPALFFLLQHQVFLTPTPGESFCLLFQALCSTSRLPPSVSGTPVILGNTRYSCVAKINSEKPVGSG